MSVGDGSMKNGSFQKNKIKSWEALHLISRTNKVQQGHTYPNFVPRYQNVFDFGCLCIFHVYQGLWMGYNNFPIYMS